MDGEYPSYTGVAPLYRQVGPYLQVHSANSDQNTYTGLWTGPFGGFQNVIQTFQRTESPRRILPVDVYYHFYSGERYASVLALQRIYQWVLEHRDELFPVYASRYISVVQGLFTTRIERQGRDTWRISGNGACRTLRFDPCPRFPDWRRSSGLLGFRHYQGALYVSLDESPEHVVALTDRPPTVP